MLDRQKRCSREAAPGPVGSLPRLSHQWMTIGAGLVQICRRDAAEQAQETRLARRDATVPASLTHRLLQHKSSPAIAACDSFRSAVVTSGAGMWLFGRSRCKIERPLQEDIRSCS